MPLPGLPVVLLVGRVVEAAVRSLVGNEASNTGQCLSIAFVFPCAMPFTNLVHDRMLSADVLPRHGVGVGPDR